MELLEWFLVSLQDGQQRLLMGELVTSFARGWLEEPSRSLILGLLVFKHSAKSPNPLSYQHLRLRWTIAPYSISSAFDAHGVFSHGHF